LTSLYLQAANVWAKLDSQNFSRHFVRMN